MRRPARMLVLLSVLAATAAAIPSQAGPVTGLEAVTSSIFQSNQSSFSGVGLRFNVHPPQLLEGITIVPGLEYWRNHSNVSTFGIETTRKDATLLGYMRYDFRREGWQPYLGAGLGMHFISAEVDAPSLGLNNKTDSLIKGGLMVLGGVTFGLAGNLGNMLEAEYHHIPDQSQLKFNWGLTWSFNPPAAQPEPTTKAK